MDEDEFISKSQRKRDSTALQVMGKELVQMPVEQLKRMALPEELLEAVLACKTYSKHEAVRRQMQYIGRIMRKIEAAPILEQLERIKAPSKRQTALFHVAEKWRDRLLAEVDAPALFAAEFRDADAAQLRRLVEAARAERSAGRAPKHARELFHFVDAVVQRHGKPA
jgi:ribosome-associated protein